MGRHAAPQAIEVHEGVYLTPAGKKGTWQCYFRLDGCSFRKSTKTRDLAQAKLKALQWLTEAQQRQSSGQQVKQVLFAELRDEYLAFIVHDAKRGYHEGTIKRHFEPFFGSVADIGSIDDGMILD